MKCVVKVTKKDIATGVSVDPHNCPLSRAVTRKLKKGFKAAIGSHIFYQSQDFVTDITRILPKEMAVFRSAFDRGDAVKPATFVLNIPKRFARLA